MLEYDGTEKELFGGERATTNNRMELTAVIEALGALKRPSHVILHTDSQYVMKGITEWIRGWKVKGWKTAAREPVKNADLWRTLDEAVARHEIQWVWVKGHSGHNGNERADALANKGVESLEADTGRSSNGRTEPFLRRRQSTRCQRAIHAPAPVADTTHHRTRTTTPITGASVVFADGDQSPVRGVGCRAMRG